jgi:hypothetical protein
MCVVVAPNKFDIFLALFLFSDLLSKAFRPGKLLKDFESVGLVMGVDKEAAINFVMGNSLQMTAGQFAQNGKWLMFYLVHGVLITMSS